MSGMKAQQGLNCAGRATCLLHPKGFGSVVRSEACRSRRIVPCSGSAALSSNFGSVGDAREGMPP